MSGFSASHFRSALPAAKYGLMYPLSNCIPSTNSSWVSDVFPSSTVMTPSLPTFSNASAIMPPIFGSLLAEMPATWAISSFLDSFRVSVVSRCSIALATALSIPFLTAIGLAPAVMFRRPSW